MTILYLRTNIFICSIVLCHWTYYFIHPTRMQFFEDLKENVILNYSRRNYLLIAARVALLFMLITNYPVGLHPGRDATNR